MGFLNRMKFASKLRLMTGAALAGLVVFSAVAYFTLRAVAVNSPLYKDIMLTYQFGADVYDPDASLLPASKYAMDAEEAETPQETAEAVQSLRKAENDFQAAYERYMEVLPAGPIRDMLQNQTYPLGKQWFDLANSKFIPLLEAGNHEKAKDFRTSNMRPLYKQQLAANQKLSMMIKEWIPAEEHKASTIIRNRTLEMVLIFLAITAGLIVVGAIIARGIVRPAHSAVAALEAMAKGDYSHCLNLDAVDEIGDISRAVNRTINSFRDVLNTITNVSTRTAAASAELTATAQDTSSQSHKHAVETAHAADEMTHMSAAIQKVSTAAQSASDSGSATKFAAEQGHQVVEETMTVIRRATEVTARASDTISSLGRNSEQIGQIIGVIEEIANQTNLLALNAAIEAARAGEQGRGFAVVAGEVRRLAERTTAATQEIASMISSIQSETASAVSVMETGREQFDEVLRKSEECDHALTEIVALVRETGNKIQEIATLAGEQSETAGRVTINMNAISGFSKHAEQASEQTAAACNELTTLVSQLESQVHTFNVSQSACIDIAA